MKRTLALMILLCGNLLASDQDEIVVPAKTEIFLALKNSVTSKSDPTGDPLYGEVCAPVSVGNRVVIPVGSIVTGHVDWSRRAGRLVGQGKIHFVFNRIVFPDGRMAQMTAVLQSAEGHETSRVAQTEGTVVAESNAPRQAVEAVDGGFRGAVKGLGAGAVFAKSFRGFRTFGRTGMAVGAMAALLRRGNEVNLARGSTLAIQLTEPLKLAR